MPFTPIDFVDQPDPLAGDSGDPKLNAANLAFIQTQYDEAIDDAAAAVDSRIGDDIQGTATLDADVTALAEDPGSDLATALNAAFEPGGSAGNVDEGAVFEAIAKKLNFRPGRQETMPRVAASSNAATSATGHLVFSFLTATEDATISALEFVTGSTAAGATPTLIRFGLYEVSGTDLVRVGATPNDTALLAAAHTLYSKSLSSPVAVTKENRYAIGRLIVTAATPPNFLGQVSGDIRAIFALDPRMSGFVAGQTDLPSTVALGSLTNHPSFTYAAMVHS